MEVHRVLDFGCGVGNAAPHLHRAFAPQRLVGYDCSAESLRVASRRFEVAEWTEQLSVFAAAEFDLVYTSGVFHHIDPAQRQAELERIVTCLKPGGYFALFENNPWNPGTQWVMRRIPFDRDAICLSVLESQRRVKQVGLELIATRGLFYFPRVLAPLRAWEQLLAFVPGGAQYLVLARKPL